MTISGGGRVDNTVGAIAAVAGSYGEVVVSGGSTWANSGALYVGGKFASGGTGTLIIADHSEVTAADVTVWPQGLIMLDDADLRAANVNLAGGRLEGTGNVRLDGQFSNAGVVAPGGSPGTLSIVNGNYVQTAAGTLVVDLGGVHVGEFDRLEIRRGGATLAGGLQVSLLDDFLPPVGSVFEILWAENNLSGAFDPLLTVFPPLPGRQWNLIQRRGTITLEILSALLIGDYNDDGMVDAADYIIWRKNLGANITLPNEDPNQTQGWVTIEDYAVWKAHYGDSNLGSGGGGLTTSTVPEPATLLMLVLAATCCSNLRRRATY